MAIFVNHLCPHLRGATKHLASYAWRNLLQILPYRTIVTSQFPTHKLIPIIYRSVLNVHSTFRSSRPGAIDLYFVTYTGVLGFVFSTCCWKNQHFTIACVSNSARLGSDSIRAYAHIASKRCSRFQRIVGSGVLQICRNYIH